MADEQPIRDPTHIPFVLRCLPLGIGCSFIALGIFSGRDLALLAGAIMASTACALSTWSSLSGR